MPDAGVRSAIKRPAGGVLRSRDLAGEPVPCRCCRPARPAADSGHRALHSSCRVRRRSETCSIRSIRFKPCRNRRSSSATCAREFGNLGLAAAAYNAGPRRVRDWMAGTGPMPAETRAYVQAITGASVEQWSKSGGDADKKQQSGPACGELMALLKRAPNPFVAALEQRIVDRLGAAVGRHPHRRLFAHAHSQQLCRTGTASHGGSSGV